MVPWSRCNGRDVMRTIHAHDAMVTMQCPQTEFYNSMPATQCSRCHDAIITMNGNDVMVMYAMQWLQCKGYDAMVTIRWWSCSMIPVFELPNLVRAPRCYNILGKICLPFICNYCGKYLQVFARSTLRPRY